MDLIADIEAMRAELAGWRRDLHAHPELGFEENRTADFVAAKLEAFGVQVYRGIGRTGLVGVLRGVMLLARLDCALIWTPCRFWSKTPSITAPRIKARCTPVGMMAIPSCCWRQQHLAATRQFQGQVNFIFQPAEEGLGGARAMIADGLFEDFPCDRIYAMHNGPGLPVGKFAAVPGVRTAAGAFLISTFKAREVTGRFRIWPSTRFPLLLS